jgi:hypothetical protein
MAQNRSRSTARIAVIAFVALVIAGGVTVAAIRGKSTTPSDGVVPAAQPPAAPADPKVAGTVVPAKPEPAAEPAKPAPKDDLAAFRRHTAAGKWYEARQALAPLFQSVTSDATRSELAARGMELNQKLLVSNPDERDIEIAEMKQGESLFAFAKRFKQFHGEYGIVKLVNSIKNDNAIRAGSKLRVPKGTWSLLVDKSLFTLWLCYEGAPFKAFKICVGADDKTPVSRWTIGVKNPKPTWYAPTEWLEKEGLKNPIAYGHAKNPLGEYWLSLDNEQGHQGFGIHGTNDPGSMGTKASMGCVRMLNEEIVEIARIAWKGMEVTTTD